MFDLSSSSPQPLTAGEVLERAGVGAQCLLDDALDYEPAGGSGDLRRGVASLYDNLSPDHVLITAGAAEAIRIVSEAAVGPGDCVVVQRPIYEPLRAAPLARRAHVHEWMPEAGFQFSLDGLPRGATDPHAVFLNNPHGPSGSLVQGAYDGSARLVADEVYRPVATSSGQAAASAIDTVGGVSIGDLSKPLGLGGLRIGWIASRDTEFMRRCSTVLDYFSGSVSALSSRVAVAALSQFESHLATHLDRARKNLSALTAFIEQHEAWIDWMPPQAGYTAFLRLKDGASVPQLVERLGRRGVFVLDGSVFESPDHVRVGYGLTSRRFSNALGVFGDELRATASAHLPAPSHGDVIVLAKDPSSGRAKTRLAVDLGADYTAKLCAAFVRDSVELAAARGRRLYISCAPAGAVEAFQSLAPTARCFAQPEAAFGRRLLHAFETAISDGARHPVLIGTDSPTLPSHLLTVAQRALKLHDVVLGPADDGGYYLIGMNVPQPVLFDGIDWSTDRVLSQTLDHARSRGLSVFVLPAWYDVDNGQELDRLSSDPLLRQHTRAALASHHPVEVAL